MCVCKSTRFRDNFERLLTVKNKEFGTGTELKNYDVFIRGHVIRAWYQTGSIRTHCFVGSFSITTSDRH